MWSPDGIFRSSDMGKTWNIVMTVLITRLRYMVKHGILFLPVMIEEKCLRYMFPAMYCTLWREILDAEK